MDSNPKRAPLKPTTLTPTQSRLLWLFSHSQKWRLAFPLSISTTLFTDCIVVMTQRVLYYCVSKVLVTIEAAVGTTQTCGNEFYMFSAAWKSTYRHKLLPTSAWMELLHKKNTVNKLFCRGTTTDNKNTMAVHTVDVLDHVSVFLCNIDTGRRYKANNSVVSFERRYKTNNLKTPSHQSPN